MGIKDLVPRLSKDRGNVPVRRSEDGFVSLQREMNRLFDDFFRSFDMPVGFGPGRTGAWGGRETAPAAFEPRVDVSETDAEVRIEVELPGMDEKHVMVEMDDEAVTLRGERKEEKEDKGKNWTRREQTYGSFYRVVALPARVDGEKATAKFKKGVLTVIVPKRPEDRKARKTVSIETD